MTKGTNNSIYNFKVVNLDSRDEIKYFCTGKDFTKGTGFTRASLYYSLKKKNGILGKYHIQRVRLPVSTIKD